MKNEANTFAEITAEAITKLRTAKIETPEVDVRILLQEASGLSHASLISQANQAVSDEVFKSFFSGIERRLVGEPVHRILGYREFYGRQFQLSKETLIPRDDTEILVETVLNKKEEFDGDHQILEIGTGSGIIAVTLACEMANTNFLATDISENALKTAKCNADLHEVANRIEFAKHNLFEGVMGKFKAIISNPPYIPESDIKTLSPEVQDHDPHRALSGGKDGLDFYREIFEQALQYLEPSGRVIVEIGINQADDVTELATINSFEKITVIKDYSGIDRVIVAQLANS